MPFELLEQKMGKSHLGRNFGFGAFIVAVLIGSLITVQTLWPQTVTHITMLAKQTLADPTTARPLPPPSPPEPQRPKAPPAPVRVGGNVQQANLIRQPKPVYPQLAKMSKTQGTVKFQAIIARDGTIQNLQLLSGPPLLVQAAMDAVKQWVYKPTLLNGEAVEVITTIDVNFALSQ